MPRRPTASHRCAGAAVALAALAVLAGCGGAAHAQRAASTVTVARTATAAPRPPSRAAEKLPGRAAQEAAVKHFVKKGRPIYCGGRHRRLVALTFDDGPGKYTPIMLRQLREGGAHATFFLVGASIERFPSMPRLERAVAAIGNHTATHANLLVLAPAGITAEIAVGKATALQAAGAPVDLFRAPFGNRSAAIDREVRRQGMVEILWDVDSTDSRMMPSATFHEISARVRKYARPGSIVLMHENRGQTIRAMRSILPALKRRDLRPVTVPELLAADPPSNAQLRAGVKGCRAHAAASRR